MTAATTIHIHSTGRSAELPDLCDELCSLLALQPDTVGSNSGPGRATIVLDADPADLDIAAPGVAPALICLNGRSGWSEPTTLSFTESDRLDRRLRGAQLPMEATRFIPVPSEPGDEVLARAHGEPVWVQRAVGDRLVDIAGILPDPGASCTPEQAESERIARFVPFVHFARHVAGYDEQTTPPLRACFVIDDPSLHWITYGYVRYRELARHAAEHGYHVSISTIPLDGTLCDRRAIRLFRENPDQLSLSFHGNNHTKREFAAEDDVALQVVAQAMRRMDRFERRTGLAVDRVAIPPHGGISHDTVEAAALLGLHGVTASPWAAIEAHRGGGSPMGLSPVARGAGGLPILLRRHLNTGHAWLPLHGFLDQPMVVYLHHQDLAKGLAATLDATADRLKRLGPVQWCSLGEMVRSSHILRSQAGVAHVWPFADHVRVEVPDDVGEVVVEYDGPHAPDAVRVHGSRGEVRAGLGSAVEVSPGELLDVTLERPEIDPYTVPTPPWRPWPVIRRMMTETRDRLRPLLRR